MMLVSLISYIDRNTLALLAPTMLGELHLTGEQYGYVVSGFSIAYTVANLIWGRWIDRFGLPIHAIGVGEKADDLRPFEASAFARSLMGLD